MDEAVTVVDFMADELEELLRSSLDDLLENDASLLENDVSERAITHKLAEHLQKRLPSMNVDCEYNRDSTRGEGAPKAVFGLQSRSRRKVAALVDKKNPISDSTVAEELTAIATYPDIIVHRRMTNRDNLLVIEVKKRNNREGDHKYDHDKLKAFTENTERHSYHYRYGVFILLDTGDAASRVPELAWFAEGKGPYKQLPR